MKTAIALLVLTLSYSVQSKWDNKYEHGQQFNGIEHQSTRPVYKESHTDNDISRKNYGHHYYNKESRHHQWESGDRQLQEHSRKQGERPYRKENNDASRLTVDPPNHNDLIPMARYVIHNADWASVATISTLPAIEGFPFSNVKSMADGYIANSTGIPYFYMSPLDFTARDLKSNSRATVLATLEETKFCAQKQYDAQDPRCTRIMLSGKMKKVKENSTEYAFAKGAMFERHPAMASYPEDHDFFVAKLKIAQIAMVDWFGGAKYIPVRDYLAFNYTESMASEKVSSFSNH